MARGIPNGHTVTCLSCDSLLLLLFSMSDWGMNSYLYAPKDDEKHRACWRDLYTLEEATELTQLVKETANKGVNFIYAISPGLDIVFSSKQELAILKTKLDQVRGMCTCL